MSTAACAASAADGPAPKRPPKYDLSSWSPCHSADAHGAATAARACRYMRPDFAWPEHCRSRCHWLIPRILLTDRRGHENRSPVPHGDYTPSPQSPATSARPLDRLRYNLIYSRHGEGLRYCTILIALPHRRVRGLDVSGEPCGVKQRISVAVARQLGLDRRQKRWLTRKFKRQRFVILKRGRDQ